MNVSGNSILTNYICMCVCCAWFLSLSTVFWGVVYVITLHHHVPMPDSVCQLMTDCFSLPFGSYEWCHHQHLHLCCCFFGVVLMTECWFLMQTVQFIVNATWGFAVLTSLMCFSFLSVFGPQWYPHVSVCMLGVFLPQIWLHSRLL